MEGRGEQSEGGRKGGKKRWRCFRMDTTAYLNADGKGK